MKGSPNIARVGSLIGDTTRASMLTALMSGKALTVSELAREAGVTVQTASSHLAKLEQGRLLKLRKQGRHKYFSLASDEVAHVLEALMGLVAGNQPLRSIIGPPDLALRHARVCYNHLAGDKGVQLYDTLLSHGHLQKIKGELRLTRSGDNFSTEFGIDIVQLRSEKAMMCRDCLDWSERRSHLAGSLGRAYLRRFEELRWVKRSEGTRVIKFTRKGEVGFNKFFVAAPSG